MKQRILALGLMVAMLLGALSTGAMAAEMEDETATYAEVKAAWPETAEVSGMMGGSVSSLKLAGTKLFSDFSPRSVAGETVRPGIDVSVYQGEIDWEAVAESGVEFAIIRCAYRGTSSGTLAKDSRYKQYIEGAKAAGLKVGAYIYSQAITEEEAVEEARFLMDLVDGYEMDLPLVIDYEYYGEGGRLYNANLSPEEHTDICNAFCAEVEKNGYQGMVYANYYMLKNYMIASQLSRVWLAQYISRTDYSGSYEYWQCTSSGIVSGISVAVDLNFWFDPSGTTGNNLPFKDVSVGQWFYGDVAWAYENGVVNGITATTFGPNVKAERGHVITMLYRMNGSPAVSGSTAFTDLTEAFYQDAVLWGTQQGITTGTSATTFSPSAAIERQALITMLYRMSGSPATSQSISSYKDAASVGEYARKAMAWAVENGIIKGYEDNTLKPQNSTTRAEVCTILMRYNELYVKAAK